MVAEPARPPAMQPGVPELTLSPSQGSMNSAPGYTFTYSRRRETFLNSLLTVRRHNWAYTPYTRPCWSCGPGWCIPAARSCRRSLRDRRRPHAPAAWAAPQAAAAPRRVGYSCWRLRPVHRASGRRRSLVNRCRRRCPRHAAANGGILWTTVTRTWFAFIIGNEMALFQHGLVNFCGQSSWKVFLLFLPEIFMFGKEANKLFCWAIDSRFCYFMCLAL
jgi:hypothetical protein